MDKLIGEFINQLEEAIIISDIAKIDFHTKKINKVFIAGMGGSGIAGRFTEEIMKLYGIVPVLISNGYDIPSWIDSQTLAIVSSYSGNTEETLSSFEKLIEKGCKVIVISSGGKLYAEALKLQLDVIKLPDNWPAPRACFGYSFIAQLYVLHKLELLKIEISKELSASIDLLLSEQDQIKSEAQSIALRLVDKIPVLYSGNSLSPLAIRFKQQLNENSKTLAFANTIPEMNHNELVGWSKKYEDLAVVIFRSQLYDDRINKRIELSKEIMIKYVDTMIEIESKGLRLLQQMLYLVNLVDWISWYIASYNGIDAMEIENINILKSELDKI